MVDNTAAAKNENYLLTGLIDVSEKELLNKDGQLASTVFSERRSNMSKNAKRS